MDKRSTDERVAGRGDGSGSDIYGFGLSFYKLVLFGDVCAVLSLSDLLRASRHDKKKSCEPFDRIVMLREMI